MEKQSRKVLLASIASLSALSVFDITVHDTDGQQGLFVPYSPGMNVLTEIASNMSQTSGTWYLTEHDIERHE